MLTKPDRTIIAAMSEAAIDKVRLLEGERAGRPQIPIEMIHTFHAGMYARTAIIPAGTLITGALIRVATLLILQGDALMYIGEDKPVELSGYNVITAPPHRKQAFAAMTETHLTMIFPTKSVTVAEAEAEFTVETDLLLSRRDIASNTVKMMEATCQA